VSTVLFIAGVLLAFAAVHPFVTYPLSLRFLARVRPRPIAWQEPPDGRLPRRVAICVCFYNEERVVRAKVENLLAMRNAVPGLEVLAYVDAATDRTAEVLREYQDVLHVVVSPQRLGKTQGMNTLIGLTDAEVIVFTDANVMFDMDAMPRLLAAFADPAVGCVCGHLVYTRPEESTTAATGSLYWRLEEHIKALESATGSVMGADGSIFAIRRELHLRPPPDLIDDMYVSLAALCGGARIVRIEDALAYEAAVSHPSEEFRRKIRIACQAFNVHRVLTPRIARISMLDRYKYVSHKLLRWLTAYLLAGSLACMVASILVAGDWKFAAALAVAIALGGALIWRARSGPLGQLREVLGAFIATAIGVWYSLRGERFQTWAPPTSARGAAA
jgi:cellulose synthase/poly-beta-1,6-N-acetylglucosamine synthase-like glycosyltransferase